MSQLPGFTIGGPRPCLAHASRTPSGATQKRISCSTRKCYAFTGSNLDPGVQILQSSGEPVYGARTSLAGACSHPVRSHGSITFERLAVVTSA